MRFPANTRDIARHFDDERIRVKPSLQQYLTPLAATMWCAFFRRRSTYRFCGGGHFLSLLLYYARRLRLLFLRHYYRSARRACTRYGCGLPRCRRYSPAYYFIRQYYHRPAFSLMAGPLIFDAFRHLLIVGRLIYGFSFDYRPCYDDFIIFALRCTL